jgi:DNA primase
MNIKYDEFENFVLREKEENKIPIENELDNIHIELESFKEHTFRFPLAWNYLKKRGIPFDVAKSFEMRFLEDGRINGMDISNRLICPIRDINDKIVSYEARDVSGLSKKKVLYPYNSSISTLYDYSKLNKDEPLYVVEGLLDLAVLRESSYFANSTCVFGAQITQRQIHLLNQFREIIVIPDNDKAGMLAMKKINENHSNVKMLDLPRKDILKDVGDIPQKLNCKVSDLVKKGWGTKVLTIL